jgi:hypothetical protein
MGRVYHTAVWTGGALLVWGWPHGLAYDPASNRWLGLPISPRRGRTGHVAVWTGSQMLIWGGRAEERDPRIAAHIPLLAEATHRVSPHALAVEVAPHDRGLRIFGQHRGEDGGRRAVAANRNPIRYPAIRPITI